MTIRTETREIFITSDGHEFYNREEAEQHERVGVLARELLKAVELDWDDISTEQVAAWLAERYELVPKTKRAIEIHFMHNADRMARILTDLAINRAALTNGIIDDMQSLLRYHESYTEARNG